jgi:hypothetical protein
MEASPQAARAGAALTPLLQVCGARRGLRTRAAHSFGPTAALRRAAGSRGPAPMVHHPNGRPLQVRPAGVERRFWTNVQDNEWFLVDKLFSLATLKISVLAFAQSKCWHVRGLNGTLVGMRLLHLCRSHRSPAPAPAGAQAAAGGAAPQQQQRGRTARALLIVAERLLRLAVIALHPASYGLDEEPATDSAAAVGAILAVLRSTAFLALFWQPWLLPLPWAWDALLLLPGTLLALWWRGGSTARLVANFPLESSAAAAVHWVRQALSGACCAVTSLNHSPSDMCSLDPGGPGDYTAAAHLVAALQILGLYLLPLYVRCAPACVPACR